MKKFNLAALPLAVAGVLASTSALAGTEACFEVYTGVNDFDVAEFATIYDLAACGDRTGATNNTLQANDVVSVAYELTGVNPTDGTKVFELDYDDIEGTNALAANVGLNGDQHIVYIPTTDIPGGTLIEMTLNGSGAEFYGNGNQIHLVKDIDGEADPGTTDGFEAIASSDGALDETNKVTFITKAGVTIGAGTRLVFSKNSTGSSIAALDPVGIRLGNTECTIATSSSSVTLSVTQAKTDGGTGYVIEGAKTKTPQVITEISPQFYALQGGTTAEGLVNAESSNNSATPTAIVARTEFVYDADTAANQVVVKQQEVIYKTAFYDRGQQDATGAPIVTALLDQYVILDASDDLKTKFEASSAPGDEVEMARYDGRAINAGAFFDQEDHNATVTWGKFGLTEMSAPEYLTDAEELFEPQVNAGAAPENNPYTGTALPASTDLVKALDGANYNEMWYVITNEQNAASGTKIMNFNYTVDTHYTLDFGDDNLLDHCAQEKRSHEIGVNGAVLKVPYVVTAAGNFVRITNEHDEAAEVTFDMFGESLDGTVENRKVTAIALGNVPAQSSVAYTMADVLAAANAAGYLGQDGGYAAGALGNPTGSNAKSGANRHTVTFTVTAPRDSVHGVSVQKIIGGLDRVMPVLDQNKWSQ